MVHREAIKKKMLGIQRMTSSSHKFEKPRGLPIIVSQLIPHSDERVAERIRN